MGTKLNMYTNTDMPNMTGSKAYVLGGAFDYSCVALMAEAGFSKARTIMEADVVVFVGGADVNPALYGERPHTETHFDMRRDTLEKVVYERCVELGIPMFGICRGAQFLHVMNGGKLWQNVNNHAGRPHMMVDLDTNETVEVTSLHHQMLKANADITLIGVTDDQIATVFEDADKSMKIYPSGVTPDDPEIEIEAGCYEKTGCFFVQGHPEIGSPEYRAWTMNKLEDFLLAWGLQQSNDQMKQVHQLPSIPSRQSLN